MKEEGPKPQLLIADLVSTHKLRKEEGTQGVVLLLAIKAYLGGRTLGGISHLSLGVSRGIGEQPTLGQHASSDSGTGIAEFGDVGLFGEAIDGEVGFGVATRFAVNGTDGVLEFYFRILFRHKNELYVSKVKGQRSKADPLYPP